MREKWNRAWWKKGCAGSFAVSDLPSPEEMANAEEADAAEWAIYLEGVRDGKAKAAAAIRDL